MVNCRGSGLLKSWPSDAERDEMQELKAKVARLEKEKVDYMKAAELKEAKMAQAITSSSHPWNMLISA